MERDTFSHILLWCPRPFSTYSQNRARNPGSGGSSRGGGRPGSPSLCKAEPSLDATRTPDCSRDGNMIVVAPGHPGEDENDVGSENTPPETGSLTQSHAPSTSSAPPSPPSPGPQIEDSEVLLNTWYVIKPGNTKEKVDFFVASQFSEEGQPRSSAMKVKGNWANDYSKAKRRRCCSSYDTPTRSEATEDHIGQDPPAPASPDELTLGGASETDLLSVAEMVALVEQRTTTDLEGNATVHGSQPHPQIPTSTHIQGLIPHQHTLLQGTTSDPASMALVSDIADGRPADEARESSSIMADDELDVQHESCRVAKAIAHFESQNPKNRLHLNASPGLEREREVRRGGESGVAAPTLSPSHGHLIAFRVSNLHSRSQSEPTGRSRCMFMSCGRGGVGGNQATPLAKEKITCDLYQLVGPSPRNPGSLLLATTTAATPAKSDSDLYHPDKQACGSTDSGQDPVPNEKKTAGVARDLVNGFHVEVVVTGAVDKCVFFRKDSTENVEEETVCFAMASAGGGGASSCDPSSDDPPPGQLFFVQPSRTSEDDVNSGGGSPGICSLDCAINGSGIAGPGERGAMMPRPHSPGQVVGGGDKCGGSPLCRLYRHVSHEFLEIRFQIQRLLEPRQYMLLLPDHITVHIFSHLPTNSLAALKCTCHHFKTLIETYGVRAVDSRWNQDPLYRDDPCKQCKRQYKRGDVSLCRWHPKPYHHDLPYGRSYWMCCRRTDKDTPGCRVGLHDNNWVQQPADGSQPTRAKREEWR